MLCGHFVQISARASIRGFNSNKCVDRQQLHLKLRGLRAKRVLRGALTLQNWLLFNVYFPLGAPFFLGIILNTFSNKNVRVFSFLRDGSLLMFCMLSAFELINDIGKLQAQLLDGTKDSLSSSVSVATAIDPATFNIAIIACACLIAASAGVYGNNIRVDESRIRRGQLKETIGALATLVLTISLIIYYRCTLEIF